MSALPCNQVLHGDCIPTMQSLPGGSVDLILTDPPYLCRYKDRSGRRVANDNRADWLNPAYAEMHRVLKTSGLCVTFFGWNAAGTFMDAWEAAGFRIVGHLVFVKNYASSQRYVRHQHEQAYILAKGEAPCPVAPIASVMPWDYTGNPLHPTQKPVRPLQLIIEAFTRPGELVLDPFCGSGSTLVAAKACGRRYLGMELDAQHRFSAAMRTQSMEWGT